MRLNDKLHSNISVASVCALLWIWLCKELLPYLGKVIYVATYDKNSNAVR